MKVDRVVLRELRMPLAHAFETSFGRDVEKNFLLVTLGAGAFEGWGECVAAENPLYGPETVAIATHILKRYLIPLYLEHEFHTAEEIGAATGFIRGHNMAKACMEMAWWDLQARAQGVSLSRALGGTRDAIDVGISLGIDEIPELLSRISEARSHGYKRYKVKIKPGWDLQVVEAVRETWADLPLMVDPNCAYSLEDVPLFEALDRFGLLMIEQPLDDEDLIDHAELQKHLSTPLCLDESIKSVDDARKAIRIGSCRIINIKPGRVGGLGPSRQIHDRCQFDGMPVWCGGMLESGIGRAHNVALASLSGFKLPGDISASRRYWAQDLVEPEFVVQDGTIQVPREPGIGVQVCRDRVEHFTVSAQTFRRT
ncbi:MAG: o-succinylbenzoate synthase [Candidatus Xenobia bacterium]